MSIDNPRPTINKMTIYFRDGSEPIVREIVGEPTKVDGYLKYQIVGEQGNRSMQLHQIMTFTLEEVK